MCMRMDEKSLMKLSKKPLESWTLEERRSVRQHFEEDFDTSKSEVEWGFKYLISTLFHWRDFTKAEHKLLFTVTDCRLLPPLSQLR